MRSSASAKRRGVQGGVQGGQALLHGRSVQKCLSPLHALRAHSADLSAPTMSTRSSARLVTTFTMSVKTKASDAEST